MTKMHERQNDDICVNQRSRIEIVHKKRLGHNQTIKHNTQEHVDRERRPNFGFKKMLLYDWHRICKQVSQNTHTINTQGVLSTWTPL